MQGNLQRRWSVELHYKQGASLGHVLWSVRVCYENSSLPSLQQPHIIFPICLRSCTSVWAEWRRIVRPQLVCRYIFRSCSNCNMTLPQSDARHSCSLNVTEHQNCVRKQYLAYTSCSLFSPMILGLAHICSSWNIKVDTRQHCIFLYTTWRNQSQWKARFY